MKLLYLMCAFLKLRITRVRIFIFYFPLFIVRSVQLLGTNTVDLPNSHTIWQRASDIGCYPRTDTSNCNKLFYRFTCDCGSLSSSSSYAVWRLHFGK